MAVKRTELFSEIRKNKRNSLLLVFLLLFLATVTGYFVGAGFWGSPESGLIGLAVAFCFILIMTLVTYFTGDMIALALSRAREIEHKDNPQLFNIVEEISIAAGAPMPRVFIIDDPAPNAFATGRNPKKSAVAVTTGLLERLNRSELQGVIAHEISHIQNYDILFGMMVGVLAGTIIIISDIARRSIFYGSLGGRRSSGNRRGGGGQAAIVMLVIGLVFIILAPIFATLIKMAVSRQREYLADSSGAKLTRYPEGLASALEKIAYSGKRLSVASGATNHLYIVNPLQPTKNINALMATHPPIEERIKRLRSM